jgi:DNA-binding transcriptional LysR family regulator
VLDLNDFFYFVQVVDRGGFTAAGRTLRIPKSTLSHHIQQLEANLGGRLLNRTSRRFGVTDAGGEFYRHAVSLLREAERAESAIRHRLNEPTGTVVAQRLLQQCNSQCAVSWLTSLSGIRR